MNNIEIGRRLREIRLSKHMTQSDVVGTYITRNMLSQIETGAATPSIKTLEYLTGVLGITVDQLFLSDEPEQETLANANILSEEPVYTYSINYLSILTTAKKHLSECKYEAAVSLLTAQKLEDSPIYDEACYIITKASIALASEYTEQGRFEEASFYINTAMKYADSGIYANDELMLKAYRLQKTI